MNENNASRRALAGLDDRQTAERKLCRLFKSFGIDALDQRERLIDPYLERASAFLHPQARVDLAALAVQEAEADLETWFESLFADRLDDRTLTLMTGRAGFLMCGGPARFADQLLRPIGDLSAAFVQAFVDAAPNAVPPSEIGEMHHQPYEAWSPVSLVTRAMPTEGGLFQSLAGLMRRDTGSTGFSWRSTGSTS